MEDALVLARTSKSVTVIHRRESFRASKILAQRVLDHPVITVKWNTVVREIIGHVAEQEQSEDGDVNLDEQTQTVKAVKLMDVTTGEESEMPTDAVFVAIGHTPTTKFLEGIVEFDAQHPGYIKTVGRSTKTSVPGIFAAGDVSDAVYRQAITSAGSGAAAALDAERYLSEEGLGNEAEQLEAELLAEIMGTGEERISYNAYAESGGRIEGMKESIAAEL
jgi:thioredoxin reductase (NADPH)